MIIYDLDCAAGHQFEGWFNRSEDYLEQEQNGLLSCPVCGSRQVKKLPTASYINTHAKPPQKVPDTAAKAPSEKQLATWNALEKLHDYVDQHFKDVGADFPEEARKIHYGEAEARNIRGSATREEAKALIEEGVEAIPLPVRPYPKNKLN
ncbi:MAG: DUF1178 family protein [Gammaproteobacteria bacterium]|nr:DUF1178 family protein [Gammaproteobacteria bacterium]